MSNYMRFTETYHYPLLPRNQKTKRDSTFDNGGTHTEMRYLAKVYNATKDERYKKAFVRGVEFMLDAQFPNGGWPQTHPGGRGYPFVAPCHFA